MDRSPYWCQPFLRQRALDSAVSIAAGASGSLAAGLVDIDAAGTTEAKGLSPGVQEIEDFGPLSAVKPCSSNAMQRSTSAAVKPNSRA